MQKQSFVHGTIILAVSALFLKTLGFINGIFLTRLLGAEGIGLLMMAHPLIPLVITLTELGLPVAISKLVSEAEMRGDERQIRRIIAISLTVTGTLSVILTCVAIVGAPVIAKLMLTDQRAFYAMVAITPIAPIVAVSAVLKGYFRGKQHMKTIATSDVIEHIAQMSCLLVLVKLLLPYGIEYAAAGAMVCSVIGEAAGLLFIVARFRRQAKNGQPSEPVASYFRNGRRTLGELLHLGLPTVGNGVIHSLFRALLPMLVTKCLIISGSAPASATVQYGLLFGCALPLLLFPNFITHSLSTALIPAISETSAAHNERLMHRRIDQAIRTALFIGTPGTVILFLWADPLTAMLYNHPEAAVLVKLLAPIFFLHYFEGAFHAVLLGLGKSATVMWNFMVSSLFEAIAIFIFASKFGIEGVAIGLGFGIVLLTMLHFSSVSKAIGFYFDFRALWKSAISAIVMAACGMGAYSWMLAAGLSRAACLPAAIAVSIVSYVTMLFLLKVFGWRSYGTIHA